MPLVSVIVPAFNCEQYIAEALASICAQSLVDLEVIVVDDGSSDNTVRTARAFEGRLDLRVIEQRNAGPSAARNTGIRLARGRYCAFLDADDLMLPDLVAAGVERLERNPRLGLVLTEISTFNESGTVHERRWRVGDRPSGELLDRLVIENFVTTSTVMAPRQCLLDAGLFPEHRRVAEDYELWLKLASRWEIAFIDRVLVRYRYTAGSLSADKRNSSQCALQVITEFWRDNETYRRSRPDVFHASLCRHLTNAGAAAARHGDRVAALGYLVRALRHAPRDVVTWKWIAKTVALPIDQMNGRRPRQSRPGVAPEAAR